MIYMLIYARNIATRKNRCSGRPPNITCVITMYQGLRKPGLKPLVAQIRLLTEWVMMETDGSHIGWKSRRREKARPVLVSTRGITEEQTGDHVIETSVVAHPNRRNTLYYSHSLAHK
jgi:hypothetical protein